MNSADIDDDPFSAQADPCPPPSRRRATGTTAADCLCAHDGSGMSRRAALAGMTFLAILPLASPAVAAMAPPRATLIPCVQPVQKPSPCRHRYCRHYGGSDDYHGR